jgi:hypothetical protein
MLQITPYEHVNLRAYSLMKCVSIDYLFDWTVLSKNIMKEMTSRC